VHFNQNVDSTGRTVAKGYLALSASCFGSLVKVGASTLAARSLVFG